MKKILWGMLLLCACQKGVSIPSGVEYVLKQDSHPVSIVFNEIEGRFSGFGGVNRYFGQYEIEGNALRLSQVGATMMMGPSEDMENERLYFETLGKITSFKLNGDKLILKTPQNELIFIPKEKLH